ncbi:GNAT family N-acetyltransferase [Dietzia massiliensis]|uniref:GNAT family N-acetyltransferase n=1 Tax=Dietzia massiliensis TaxID=2697499 RepID=UPI001BCD3B20|nr:GNAT family N-acetyltransferase [Dietzia massiliensis]MBS7548316.1 GNAT family N-acetyltransferase [Dietzia massiliensis]
MTIERGWNEGPDLYFNSGYGLAAARAEGAEWISLVLDGGNIQMPLLVRQLESGRLDAASPYGYCGVYAADATRGKNADLWRRIRAELLDLGVISVFVRSSPLVSQLTSPPDSIWVVEGHSTYLVDVSEEDEAWSAMEGRARTAVRKARKTGISASFRVASREDLCDGSDFRRMYDSTMRRVGAKTSYFFSDDYYEALRSGLGDSLLVGVASDSDGSPVAAALFMKDEHTLHYHLSGASAEGAKTGGTSLLIWEAGAVARSSGIGSVHLGGGLRPGDGLDRFKRSFGGSSLSFGAWGLVLDVDGYEEETTNRATQLGVTPEQLQKSGFFPAYRSPSRDGGHL